MAVSELKIKELITDICREKQVILLDVDIRGGGRNRQVKVTVDTESGVSLDECKQVSKDISDIFFRKDIYPDGYNLEVSSPGVDKPLQHDFEFRRNIGRDLTVQYKAADDIKKLTGKLNSFSGKGLHLTVGKENIVIPLSEVQSAKVKLKW